MGLLANRPMRWFGVKVEMVGQVYRSLIMSADDSEVNTVPKWTNRSVIALSGELDPITEITRRARDVVLSAME